MASVRVLLFSGSRRRREKPAHRPDRTTNKDGRGEVEAALEVAEDNFADKEDRRATNQEERSMDRKGVADRKKIVAKSRKRTSSASKIISGNIHS